MYDCITVPTAFIVGIYPKIALYHHNIVYIDLDGQRLLIKPAAKIFRRVQNGSTYDFNCDPKTMAQ